MQGSLSRYVMLARRWAWMVVLGIVICGGATYVVSKLTPPVYQASVTVIINLKSATSAYDNIIASEQVVPTYAQLLTNPSVLEPVVAAHQGMTLQQLISMISVKPQSNTQLIELDVKSGDPQLAMQLANEISQSFARFSNSQLSGTVYIVSAKLPTDPISSKPLQNAGIGALVGLGLALALIVIFEWIDDLPASPEEVQELLDMEVLTVIPRFSDHQRLQSKKPEEILALAEGRDLWHASLHAIQVLMSFKPITIINAMAPVIPQISRYQHLDSKKLEEMPALAEACHLLCISLNAEQAVKPFKLVMVTSVLAGEGKSIIATTLASLLAIADKSVLLVDANMRNPVLDQRFQLDNHQGLSTALLEVEAQPEVARYSQATNIPTLRVLTAGVFPANPAELLQSRQAKRLFDQFAQASFDYIIFDTPALLPIADAQILSSHVQTIVLVVDASRTSRRMLLRARRVLKRMHTVVLGVAMNKNLWSDYGDMRQYRGHVRQSETDITMTIPPDTPLTESLVDSHPI